MPKDTKIFNCRDPMWSAGRNEILLGLIRLSGYAAGPFVIVLAVTHYLMRAY